MIAHGVGDGFGNAAQDLEAATDLAFEGIYPVDLCHRDAEAERFELLDEAEGAEAVRAVAYAVVAQADMVGGEDDGDSVGGHVQNCVGWMMSRLEGVLASYT